eukprot:97995-Hanusia_phi.AAC.1
MAGEVLNKEQSESEGSEGRVEQLRIKISPEGTSWLQEGTRASEKSKAEENPVVSKCSSDFAIIITTTIIINNNNIVIITTTIITIIVIVIVIVIKPNIITITVVFLSTVSLSLSLFPLLMLKAPFKTNTTNNKHLRVRKPDVPLPIFVAHPPREFQTLCRSSSPATLSRSPLSLATSI